MQKVRGPSYSDSSHRRYSYRFDKAAHTTIIFYSFINSEPTNIRMTFKGHPRSNDSANQYTVCNFVLNFVLLNNHVRAVYCIKDITTSVGFQSYMTARVLLKWEPCCMTFYSTVIVSQAVCAIFSQYSTDHIWLPIKKVTKYVCKRVNLCANAFLS